MKKAAVVLFLLLPALSAFGRNATEQEIARALKRALMARDSLSHGAAIEVSTALATGKDVCIEYRATAASGLSISGQAVYHIEDDLVFLDNSWKWESACLSGKYGQRRTGKDLTHAINASLAMPVQPAPAQAKPAPIVAVAAAPALPMPAAPTVASASVPVGATLHPMPAGNAVVISQPIPATSAALISQPAPTPAITRAPMTPTSTVPVAAHPVAVAPPVPTAPVVATTPVPAPAHAAVAVATPVSVSSPAPAPTAKQTVTADVITPGPKHPALSAPVPAENAAMVVDTATLRDAPIPVVAMPTPASNVVHLNPAASVETPLHGVTISDPEGALGPPTQTISQGAPQESLADAARRVRRMR